MKTVLIHVAEVTSTNDEARRLAEAGAAEGTFVWADHQSEGRGRQGRVWISAPGENVLVSVVLRPCLEPARLGAITMMGAVAVRETIAITTGLDARLKWPNDVLIRGRKVSGMLLESAQDATHGKPPRFVILGIGINVNQCAFPSDPGDSATSLTLEAGTTLSRHAVVDVLMRRIESYYDSVGKDGGAGVREKYMALLEGLGESATVRLDGASGAVTGRMVGVSVGGALELELSDGRREQFYAGEVTTRAPVSPRGV
jgi:BirA family biotin operon repressor/biotin-[acetyl-CoA-carboxylase] ligase